MSLLTTPSTARILVPEKAAPPIFGVPVPVTAPHRILVGLILHARMVQGAATPRRGRRAVRFVNWFVVITAECSELSVCT